MHTCPLLVLSAVDNWFFLLLTQGCPVLLLEGHCPAEFSSNPN